MVKIKRRLIISFFTVILLPVILIAGVASAIVQYQTSLLKQDYGLEGNALQMIINPVQILNRMTSNIYVEIKKTALMDPEQLENIDFVDSMNKKLKDKYSFLVVEKEGEFLYIGEKEEFSLIEDSLPNFGDYEGDNESGIYAGSRKPYLIKKQDFYFKDGKEGSIFLITETDNVIPQVRVAITQLMMSVILILCLTAFTLIIWIYQGIVRPLNLLRKATKKMMEGDLEYSLMPELQEEIKRSRPMYQHFLEWRRRCRRRKLGQKEKCCETAYDEIGILCEDFEKMRLRMKKMMEKRVQFEEDQRELISNISHDLKTPLTAIKGYTEGIMDGVAETPEKRDRYLKTIYTKANDMTALVDELSFYSKIDCNTIPYEFAEVNVNEYFKDCVAEIGLDLEVKGINLTYFNYVDNTVEIVADAEKLKRVINNVIGNSVKYMDKKKGSINIRIRDVGDFVEIEVEDNGKGIPQKDVNNIFDRFYRSDVSRNSRKGGSGLGLAISKKIIEDHGGKIRAASKENVGTSIYFTLCKSKPNMVMKPEQEEENSKEEKRIWRLKKRMEDEKNHGRGSTGQE